MTSFRKPNREQVGKDKESQHIYLGIPKDMQDCVYNLRLVDFKFVEEKTFFVVEFEVLATDTPIKAGKIVSKVLDPNQKLAATYFYRELYDIRQALRGKVPSGKVRDKLAAKQDTSVEGILAVLEGLEGRECRALFERYTNKDGAEKYSTSWLPAEESGNE